MALDEHAEEPPRIQALNLNSVVRGASEDVDGAVSLDLLVTET